MAGGVEFGMQYGCIEGEWRRRDYKGFIYGQAENKIVTYILNFGTVLFSYFAEPMKMEDAATSGPSVLW